jgi:hypothetical protein
MEECAKQKLEELRRYAIEEKDEDLLFLLERYDKSLEKRNNLLQVMERSRAETNYHRLNWAFYKREIDQFILAMQKIVSLDQEDGRFAEICQQTLQAYEERASSDKENGEEH